MTDLPNLYLALAVQLRKTGAAAFTPLGLSWREAVMLLTLEQGVIRPTDLAKSFGMVMPTVSALGSKLETSGLIERNIRLGNGREITYDLTAKGRALCQRIKKAWEDALPVELLRLSDKEKSVLREMFSRMSVADTKSSDIR